MTSFDDLTVRSITVAPSSFTLSGNYTNYITSNVALPYYSYTPPAENAPMTPEDWLRHRVREICELAA